MRGAHGAYFVTFFWAHFSPKKEMAEVRNMAKAAKAMGVKHAIWSTLEDTRHWVPLSDTRMPFPGAEDLGNMFQFKRDFEEYFCGARNLNVARSLNASLQSFSVWLARNKGRIPLE